MEMVGYRFLPTLLSLYEPVVLGQPLRIRHTDQLLVLGVSLDEREGLGPLACLHMQPHHTDCLTQLVVHLGGERQLPRSSQVLCHCSYCGHFRLVQPPTHLYQPATFNAR